MSPYVHPGPDTDQHARAIATSIPESPSSASTTVSSDTINTAPSGLSSEILRESVSPRSLSESPDESTNTKTSQPQSQSTRVGPFTQHKRFFFEDGNITFLVRCLPWVEILCSTNFNGYSGGWHPVSRPSLFLLPRFETFHDAPLAASSCARGLVSSCRLPRKREVQGFRRVSVCLISPVRTIFWPSNISCYNHVIDLSFSFYFIFCSEISTHWRNSRLKSCHLFWTCPLDGVSPVSATWPSAV
jgi:hypothetical protein